MTDYADNYTARYKLSYTCGGMPHTQTWRMGLATNVGAIATAINKLTDVWQAAAVLMANDLAFSGAVFYPVNADIAIPAPLPPEINGVVNSGQADLSSGPKYLSVPWTTGAGGKQTTFFYGTILDPDEIIGFDYRLQQGGITAIDALLAEMAAMVVLVTGNDRSPGYGPKAYANFGVNPALVRKRRRG